MNAGDYKRTQKKRMRPSHFAEKKPMDEFSLIYLDKFDKKCQSCADTHIFARLQSRLKTMTSFF